MSTAPVSAPDHAHQRRAALVAILLTTLGYACFNVGDAVLKLLAARYTAPQILVINGSLVIALTCIYGAWREGRAAFRLRSPRWVLLRSLFALGTGFANITALPRVSLTTFYTLIFTSPFWVAILSALFLGEKLTGKRIVVIMAGFVVIAWILRPGSDIFNVYSFVVLGSAFLYSVSVVIMRYLGTRESRTMMISIGSLVGVMAGLPFFIGQTLPAPTWQDAGLFAMLSGFGALGVAVLAHAFQTAPSAAVIAPFHYTQMIWGALLGYFLFAEVPDVQTMVGAGLLIAGGLALIWIESRAARASVQGKLMPFQAGGWFSRLRAYSPSPKER